jgi:hypothetical protein
MVADQPEFTLPWMPRLDETEGKPSWDQDEADWLIGKYVLAGITYLAADGKTVTSQHQFHGRITKADASVGFTIECQGAAAGKTMVLPPHLQAFRLADRANTDCARRVKSSKIPDILTTWSVVEPSKS